MQISNLRQSTNALLPKSDLPLGRVWQAVFQASASRVRRRRDSPFPIPHSPFPTVHACQVCFWPRRSARGNQVRFWPASRPHLAPELASGLPGSPNHRVTPACRQNRGRPKVDWNRRCEFGKLRDAPLRDCVPNLAAGSSNVLQAFFEPEAIDADSQAVGDPHTSPEAQARGHFDRRFLER